MSLGWFYNINISFPLSKISRNLPLKFNKLTSVPKNQTLVFYLQLCRNVDEDFEFFDSETSFTEPKVRSVSK